MSISANTFRLDGSLLLFVSLLLIAICCKQEPIEPFPANIQLGCFIDGTRWTPYAKDFKQQTPVARYLAKEKTLFVGGFNDSQGKGFSFGLANYTGQTGTYTLDSSCTDLPRVCANTGDFSTSPYFEIDRTYITNNRYTGIVIVTEHTQYGVTGTFAFEAQNPKTGNVVRITQGRFNIDYRTY